MALVQSHWLKDREYTIDACRTCILLFENNRQVSIFPLARVSETRLFSYWGHYWVLIHVQLGLDKTSVQIGFFSFRMYDFFFFIYARHAHVEYNITLHWVKENITITLEGLIIFLIRACRACMSTSFSKRESFALILWKISWD